MSNYENQIQATGQYYDQEIRKAEHNGSENLKSVDPGRDLREGEWANVLRELREASEAYY